MLRLAKSQRGKIWKSEAGEGPQLGAAWKLFVKQRQASCRVLQRHGQNRNSVCRAVGVQCARGGVRV